MNIEKFIKQNSTIIIYAVNILIALYIYGEGTILSYQSKPIIVYALLIINLVIYNYLHKDIIRLQTEKTEIEKKARQEEENKAKPKTRNDPFDFEEDVFKQW